jgi:hypothetical protein
MSSPEKKLKQTKRVSAAVTISRSGPGLSVRLAIAKVLPNDAIFHIPDLREAIYQCDKRARGVDPDMNHLEREWLAEVNVEITGLSIQLYHSGQRYPLPDPPLALPSTYHSLVNLTLDSVDLGDRTEFLLQLPALLWLVVENCGLTRVPPELEHSKQLKSVEFCANAITHIPLFVGYLPCLRFVEISEEPSLLAHELPVSVRGIQSLRLKFEDNLPHRILHCQHRLGILLLNGLVEAEEGKSSPWTSFLFRGLYDPRLFLHIWAFVPKED